MFIALTRAVPSSIASCQLTHLDPVPIHLPVARAQHEAYNRGGVRGFGDYEQIEVHAGEAFGANALRIGDALIYSKSFPRTLERLKNYDVRTVDASELAKAEGGVTCCSVIFAA